MIRRRPPPVQKADDWNYAQLWRIVDGAVRDTFAMHPNYITGNKEHVVRESINKRVVGAVLGYATQVAQARSGAEPAGDSDVRSPKRGDIAGLYQAFRRRLGFNGLSRSLFRSVP